MNNPWEHVGLTGQDVQHIYVVMKKVPKIVEGADGQPDTIELTYDPCFAHGNGDVSTCNPTEYRFILVNNDGHLSDRFRFHRFEFDGKLRHGVTVDDDCGYTDKFLDDAQKAIALTTDCKVNLWRQEYVLVVEDTLTGRLYKKGPGTSDQDRPGGGGGNGP